MSEIWTERGLEGVIALLADCGAPIVVGEMLEPCIQDGSERFEFARRCLSVTDGLQQRQSGAFADSFGPSTTTNAALSLRPSPTVPTRNGSSGCTGALPSDNIHGACSISMTSRSGTTTGRRYNRNGTATRTRSGIEMIGRLLDSGRPHVAFHAANFDWSRVETSQLRRLLFDMAAAGHEPEEHYRPGAHQISEALSELTAVAASIETNWFSWSLHISTRSITVGMASPTWKVRSRNLHFPLFRSWPCCSSATTGDRILPSGT